MLPHDPRLAKPSAGFRSSIGARRHSRAHVNYAACWILRAGGYDRAVAGVWGLFTRDANLEGVAIDPFCSIRFGCVTRERHLKLCLNLRLTPVDPLVRV